MDPTKGEITEAHYQEIPRDVYKKAGFFNRKLWFWVGTFLSVGYRRQLNESDLLELEEEFTVQYELKAFEKIWAVEVKRPFPSLRRALARQFGSRLAFCVLCNVCTAMTQIAAPLLLRGILRHLADDEAPAQEGYALAIMFGLLPSIGGYCTQTSQKNGHMIGMGLRSVVSAIIYQKSFKLSNSARQHRTIGEIQNLMAFDGKTLGDSAMLLPTLFSAPILILSILTLLGLLLGPAMILGVVIMLFSIPITGIGFGIIAKKRREQSKYVDRRLKLMSQMLQGVRLLKYYTWERFFIDSVNDERQMELKQLFATKLAGAVIGFAVVGTPLLVTVSTFGLYVRLGNTLTADVAFPSLLLFSSLVLPLAFFPVCLATFITMSIALSRVTSFYMSAERAAWPPAVTGPPPSEDVVVIMKGAEFLFTEKEGMSGFEKEKYVPYKVDPEKEKAKQAKIEAKKAKMAAKKAKKEGKQVEEVVQAEKETEKKEEVKEAFGKVALSNIDIEIKSGQLVVVCGTVGSGKTSLLEAILGEMVHLQGEVVVQGKMGYTCQNPWIVNSTIRENILFGNEMNESRYKKVIEACCLTSDLKMFPAGDQTEIGERGINLSGGQKARVALARACYSSAPTLLLDDPLSAVDSHVGKALTENCLKGFLGKRTRILVTNNLHVLPDSDLILVMKDGTVVEQGTYTELMDKQETLFSLMESYSNTQTVDELDLEVEVKDLKEEETDKVLPLPDIKKSIDQRGSSDLTAIQRSSKSYEARLSTQIRRSMNVENVEEAVDRVRRASASFTLSPDFVIGDGILVTDEDRAEGSVKKTTYVRYIKECGGWRFFLLYIFLAGSVQASRDIGAFFLSAWTAEVAKADSDENVSDSYYLGIYGIVTFIAIVAQFLKTVNTAFHTIQGSRTIHEKLIRAVFRPPVMFFDITPTGRILNRFSKDMDTVDVQLVAALDQAAFVFINTLGNFITIGFVLPLFFVFLIPILVAFYFTQHYFRPTTREVQRLEATTKSPIYNHFQETLNGIPTLRAYQAEPRFCLENLDRIDRHSRAWWLLHAGLNRWLGYRLDIIGSTVVLSTALLAVSGIGSTFSSSSYIGLVLVYASSITPLLNFGVIQFTESEAKMTSFERVMEYTKLASESAEATPQDKQLAKPWPSQGAIEFQKVSMSYRPGLKPVLKSLSLAVEGGHNVGICGRTGAGKSSIMVVLFRFVEPLEGKVLIDGQDISQLGLTTLRQNVVIMPQDAFLFTDTVRKNLDPTGLAESDDEIWSALEAAQADTFIRALDGGLDALVSENGDNFSGGQKQCLCMARALVRKPRILILDEATASVDAETDLAIQTCIRTRLTNVTCLTIAHRLHTIMDSNKILVMESGRVGEYDTPSNLLHQPKGGLLASLVEETGPESAAFLRDIADGKASVLNA